MSIETLARLTADRLPAVRPALKAAYWGRERLVTAMAEAWPSTIRARTERITVAITAHCNLRCVGCKYGRDFMPGSQLPLPIFEQLVEDAAAAGVPAIRIYGGEPLLHPDVVRMFELGRDHGIGCYLTTNGLVLDQRIDALWEAGLRKITFGYYGQAEEFDRYVQRPGRHERLVRSLDYVRSRYDAKRLPFQFNFLLSRRTLTTEALDAGVAFARRYGASMQIDLVHYSLPYFDEGPERELQFRAEDRPAVERIVERLLQLKAEQPELLTASEAALRSIPDWAIGQTRMDVPCDVRKLIWVGADGSVQLCYVTFPLGNLHQTRLRDILGTPAHHDAARRAFQLDCPRCHCEYPWRIDKHGPSRRKYAEPA